MVIKTLTVGQMQTNCYLLIDQKSQEVIIIDPGDDAQFIEDVIRDLDARPKMILATHGHFDHILAVWELQNAYNIPFAINQKDEFLIKRMKQTAEYFLDRKISEITPHINQYLKKDETISIGDMTFKIIETPGHTPGSVCLYCKYAKLLLTGDTLFFEGVGRTDFNYSSASEMAKSLQKILKLPQDTVIYSGHGDVSDIETAKSYLKTVNQRITRI